MADSIASSSSSSSDPLLQSLASKGWFFDDFGAVKSIASGAGLESELCNLDLRAVGGKSLPDPSSLLRKSIQLRIPIVLQVASAKDVSRSSFASSSGNRRLLKLRLTDGHTEVTAIEYSYIPSLPDDVVPGTKIRLVKKPVVRNGIICLVPGVINVLGGVVQTLFEEWEMNQKYSGFSRSSLANVRENGAGGPPPFEKLRVGGSRSSTGHNVLSLSASRKVGYKGTETLGDSQSKQEHGQKKIDTEVTDGKDNNPKGASSSQQAEEKPSSSQSRPKEVVEFAPVQNQAAAQKLLQKMNQPTLNNRRQRGQRNKGKMAEEDKPVFTLDEWEKRRAGVLNRVEGPDLTHDEDLAWQLQHQFDLEDQVQSGPHVDAASDIKMSMFSFEKDDDNAYERTGSRGRGRGRGRGRSRGRGRGRGRGGF